MDYNARFYSPTIGKFTQPDPIIPNLADSQSWNHYSYTLNNPINYIDPSGHVPESACGFGGGECGTTESHPGPSDESGDDDIKDNPDEKLSNESEETNTWANFVLHNNPPKDFFTTSLAVWDFPVPLTVYFWIYDYSVNTIFMKPNDDLSSQVDITYFLLEEGITGWVGVLGYEGTATTWLLLDYQSGETQTVPISTFEFGNDRTTQTNQVMGFYYETEDNRVVDMNMKITLSIRGDGIVTRWTKNVHEYPIQMP